MGSSIARLHADAATSHMPYGSAGLAGCPKSCGKPQVVQASEHQEGANPFSFQRRAQCHVKPPSQHMCINCSAYVISPQAHAGTINSLRSSVVA